MSQISANDSARSDLLVRAQQSTDRGDLRGAQTLLLDLIESGHDEAESERDVHARVQLAEVYEAGMCYRRALRLLRNTTDEVTRARLQTNQGVMQLLQGNFYEAANSLRRALEHLANAPSDHLTGIVYNNLAVISIYTGEWS